MIPTEFKISNLIESYEEKTAENYRNCDVTEKRIISKLTKISILNFNSMNENLELRLYQNFTFLLYFPRNKLLKSIRFFIDQIQLKIKPKQVL